MSVRIGRENLRLAKELGIETDDISVMARCLEILSEYSNELAMTTQDELELKASYLKAKYIKKSNIADRDHRLVRGQLRGAHRDEYTTPRGRLLEDALEDAIELDLETSANLREQAAALKDLLWGLNTTCFGRRRTLEEISTNSRKDRHG